MQNVETIRTIITPIAREYGIKKIYLFGSYAKGTATEESDVDLLIESGNRMTFLTLSGLRQDMCESLKLPVDIVTINALDDDFRASIKDDEVMLYEEQG